MDDIRRATIYFEPDLHRALKLKAAATDQSISEMVNHAVRLTMAEDAEDLMALEERAAEDGLDFAAFVKSLRRSGKL